MAAEAVLFDYSGVLTTGFTVPTENVPYDADLVFSEMATALSSIDAHPWHALERGEISLVEFIAGIEEVAPGAGVLFAVGSEHNVMANLDLLQHRIDLVRELAKGGVALALVTNNVAEWQPLWRNDLLDGLFDVIIDSAEVGMRKPDAEIYELALSRLGIADASRAIFVDDFEWNVAGAMAVGMDAMHCTQDLDLRAALLARLPELES